MTQKIFSREIDPVKTFRTDLHRRPNPSTNLTNMNDTKKFDSYLAALEQYAAREGHAKVPVSHHELFEGRRVPLGAWVGYTRQRYRRGLLTQERIQRLSGLTGWEWGPLTPGPTVRPGRDQEIMMLRRQGLSLQKIADKYDLSRQRVHQIVKDI